MNGLAAPQTNRRHHEHRPPPIFIARGSGAQAPHGELLWARGITPLIASAASSTAPAWAHSAGSSNAASRACTTSAAYASATNATPPSTPRSSRSSAQSSAGDASGHCERPSKPADGASDRDAACCRPDTVYRARGCLDHVRDVRTGSTKRGDVTLRNGLYTRPARRSLSSRMRRCRREFSVQRPPRCRAC